MTRAVVEIDSPRDLNDIEMVTGWLRSAMRAGSTGGPWEDGYPLRPDEWPSHMERTR
ncbi:hypothetical protein [Candidatus Poriferisodalis sp.]|uniref:hypothetical protein n=1 Tax=Candidatus Poriferisodalis sp. TaxID=3101277 RepID=UPI003B5291D1